MRIALAVILLAVAATTPACSLALPRLAPPACEGDLDCERFNTQHAERVTTCERYQCNEATRRCFFGPIDRDGDGHFPTLECAPMGDDCDDTVAAAFSGRAEECDGVDNDCDGVVDDGIPLERSVGVATRELGPVRALGWTRDAAGATALVATETAGAARSASVHALDGSAGATGSLVVRSLRDPTAPLGTELADGCPRVTDGFPTDACTLDHVALAAGSPRGFVAFVNTDGCADGQLRVGLLDPAASSVAIVGPDLRSNTWRGIDLEGACTRATAGTTGAAAPAIATVDGSSAVVAWIRDRSGRTCGAATAEVAALGLWRASGLVGGAELDWLVATGGGAPAIVGRTSGVAAPALVATGSGEAIVAFPDEHGGVRVVLVPPLPALPSPLDPASTSAIVVGEAAVVGEGAADAVAIATTPSGGDLRIAITWVAGCPAGALHVATLVWRRGAARTLETLSTAVLATAGAATPAIIHVPRGFVRSGFDRGGGSVGDETGGWLVVWRDETMSPPTLVAARVLGADGETIDDVALPIARELSADPRRPFLYPGVLAEAAFAARIAFHGGDARVLAGGELLCPPGP